MKCPHCSSTDTAWKSKASKWECNACEERFEGQPPRAEQVDSQLPKKAAKPKRIFFSYGHDGNRELVDRFKTDLEARGHQVWIDYKEIGSWDDWKGTITRGIHDAEMAIAFLSIHSTRDPGVCRNEVAMALQHFGKVYPVLVEHVPLESIPVTVAHLQWPDLSRWREFRDQEDLDFERFYEEKLLEIVSRVEGEAGRFASEAEVLRRVLNPTTFEGRFARHLDGFTGREWVFDAYENWLDHQPSSRVFWVKAGPGFGKTALAVQMANRHRAAIVGTWFCDHQSVELRDPVRALQTIAYQLALRWDDYRVRLLPRLGISADSMAGDFEIAREKLQKITNPEEDVDIQKILQDAFSHLISEPISGLIWREHKLVILIDALDEAVKPDGTNPLAALISGRFMELPEWIGFVVTSRPDASVVPHLQGFKPFAIEAFDARNTVDLQTYCTSQVGPLLPIEDREKLCAMLVEKSSGMMLYLRLVAEGLHEGTMLPDALGTLESGLPGLHSRYYAAFEVRFRKDFNETVQPLLRLIMATPGPLPLELAYEILGWNRESLVRARMMLGSYLLEDQGALGFFHKTLPEWLGGQGAGFYFTDPQPMRQALLDKLVEKFVESIHADPWHQMWRGKFTGIEAIGWEERLSVSSLSPLDAPIPADLLERIRLLANNVVHHIPWSSDQESDAVQVATEIFRNEGAPTFFHNKNLTVPHIRAVLEMAIHSKSKLTAPGNSFWFALAALATEHLPKPLVKWNSRVSLSVCTRLKQVAEQININPHLLQGLFHHRMGWVPGRGARRESLIAGMKVDIEKQHDADRLIHDSELVKAWFPCKFGNWEAQFAGSDFIRDVRDHLNSKPDKYPKPKNSCSRKWSIREVEYVVSMDGL